MSRRLIALVASCAAGLGACGLESAPGETDDGALRGRIAAVVDGDTVRVRIAGGATESVRLLGIDTPEAARPSTPVQCGARQASGYLQRLLDRDEQAVVLRPDPGQDSRDRFGRLLAYVELPSGTDLGLEQVRAGWARPYVYGRRPFSRLRRYENARGEARDARRGVHRFCGGRFDRPVLR